MRLRERVAAVVFALTIGLGLTGNAVAQGLTIDEYRHPNSDAELSFNRGYLTGVKDGLTAYNMAANDKLFCLTGDVPVLSFEQANGLLMGWARKRGSGIGGTFVDQALVTALRERYPCPAK